MGKMTQLRQPLPTPGTAFARKLPVPSRFTVLGIAPPIVVAMLALGSRAIPAQPTPTIVGDYTATVTSTFVVRLHLRLDAEGALTGSADIPSQSEFGDPLEDIHLEGRDLSFAITRHTDGEWKGTVAGDGRTLTGTFIQWAGSMPMNFVRSSFVPAAKPSAVDGIWLARVGAGKAPRRIQVVVRSDDAGSESCVFDLPDQRQMGAECANVVFAGGAFSFDLPVASAHWSGKLSADGRVLAGTWSQGKTTPLNFARQTEALNAVPVPPPVYSAAMAPVAAADLASVLDRDLAEALTSGELAPATGAGVSIGVVEHGVMRVIEFGAAKPDSIFEIGAVTKTFTGLLLSQMVAQGKARLDEPVRELLPPGTVAKPDGPEITLLDLATHRSGLRWFPSNFYYADADNPFADYSAAKLYAFLGRHGVAKRADATIRNSELAFGLLGQALANRAGTSYSALLKDEIAGPLGMLDTAVSLSPEQQIRLLPGHDADHRPARAWDFDSLAGAGAVRSTAGDMLLYLEANLHPESLKPLPGSPGAATLSAALIRSHRLQPALSPETRIALGWLYQTATGDYWHNGATGGYSSYAFFNPKGDYAGVVLLNASPGSDGAFVDRLGQHISQRLAGKPAVSLAN
jgi:CubicO group peptidase (beta-lactamase class C family)